MTISPSAIIATCEACGRTWQLIQLPRGSDRRTLIELARRGSKAFVDGCRELTACTTEDAALTYSHLSRQRGSCCRCGMPIGWADLEPCPHCRAVNVQWHEAEPNLPCPVCGFIALVDNYGRYEICPVCGWEDDCVQLANPTSGGGANSESLFEAQLQALERFPLEVQLARSFRRDPAWRPLSQEEVRQAEVKRAVNHWHTPAVVELDEAYWRRGAA